MKQLLMLFFLLFAANDIKAQEIKIIKFERNFTSLIASVNPIYDNAGDACAVIKILYPGEDLVIEPNLGILKKEERLGEIRLWVPKGTKRLTIRHKGSKPLSGYVIPIKIEPKCDYEADVAISEISQFYKHKNNVYLGAGFNIVSIAGPSVSLGLNLNHHNIEFNAIYGINRSSNAYISSNAICDFNAIRMQIKYGYEIKAPKYVSFIPQIGYAFNVFNAKNKGNAIISSSEYRETNSMSISASIEVIAHINKTIKIQITSEYDFGVYRSRKCTKFEKLSYNLSNWTEGVNLNAGILILF